MKYINTIPGVLLIILITISSDVNASYKHEVAALIQSSSSGVDGSDQMALGYRYYFDKLENGDGPYEIAEFLQRTGSVSVISATFDGYYMLENLDGNLMAVTVTGMNKDSDLYYEVAYSSSVLDSSISVLPYTKYSYSYIELKGGAFQDDNTLATISIVQDDYEDSVFSINNRGSMKIELAWKNATLNTDGTTYTHEFLFSSTTTKPDNRFISSYSDKSIEYRFGYFPDKVTGIELNINRTSGDSESTDGTTLGLEFSYFVQKNLVVYWSHDEYISSSYSGFYDRGSDAISASYRF